MVDILEQGEPVTASLLEQLSDGEVSSKFQAHVVTFHLDEAKSGAQAELNWSVLSTGRASRGVLYGFLLLRIVLYLFIQKEVCTFAESCCVGGGLRPTVAGCSVCVAEGGGNPRQ